MIVGTKERFAIEAEIEERVGDWVFGHIRFWICDVPVGNWADWADLLGCMRWLRDFRDVPRNRYEPGLWGLASEEVFRLVYDPVIGDGGEVHSAQVHDAFSRFHISHLGMSSFDCVDILFLKNEHGAERCLWRNVGDGEIHDCRLWRNEMESVAGEFCVCLEEAIAATPSSE